MVAMVTRDQSQNALTKLSNSATNSKKYNIPYRLQDNLTVLDPVQSSLFNSDNNEMYLESVMAEKYFPWLLVVMVTRWSKIYWKSDFCD